MKTKLNKQLILSFIGILIVLLSYYLIYLNFLNKTEILENDSHEVELKNTEFEKLQENSSFYLSEIDRMQSEMDTLYKEFPDNMMLENCIMMSKNMEDTIDSLEISSISLGEIEEMNESNSNNGETSNPNGVNNANTTTTTPGSTTDAAGTSNSTTSTTTSDAAGTSNATAPTTTSDATTGTSNTATSGTTNPTTSVATGTTNPTTSQTTTASSENQIASPILYKSPLNITYKVNYEGLKKLINFIYNKKERMTLETISIFCDSSTGELSGDALINIYTMKGTNNTNKALVFPSISHGTDNIFGSLTPQKDDEEN